MRSCKILRRNASQGILARMQTHIKTYAPHAVISIALAIFFVFAWYIARPMQVDAPYLGSATSTSGSPTNRTESGLVTTGGGYGVSLDNTIELPMPPDFRTPVVFSADVGSDVRTIITQRLAALRQKLSGDSYDLAAWTDLGTLHKMAGDYAGAETAWVFITKAAPTHPTAYANLADLYMNFLKDYPKADAMYKKVIALSPDAVDAYISESLLYEGFYKAGGNPETVLKSGLAANKSSVELNLALARYYTRTGRTADAKEAYQKSVEIAQTSGNAALATQIKAEAGL